MKTYYHGYDEDYTSSLPVNVGNIQEKTPLVGDEKLRRRKTKCGCCVLHMMVVTTLVLLALACCILDYTWIARQEQLPSSNKDTLVLLAENVSVLVTNYTVPNHQRELVSITEKVLDEDWFHWNDFVSVPSSMIKTHRSLIKENTTVVPIVDNAMTLNERYVYLLDGSVLKYTVCGSNASESTTSTFYGFNNEQSYNDYISSLSLTAFNNIYSKKIDIGGKNNTICTSFTFIANATSYYFFALKTRYANTNISYTLLAEINQLSIMDYVNSYNSCRINDNHKSCSIETGPGQWAVIGFSHTSYSFNSHLNHVQVSVSQTQGNLFTILHCGLFYGGVALFGLCLLYVLVVLAFACLLSRKRSFSVVIVYD